MLFVFDKYGNLVSSETEEKIVQNSVGVNTIYAQFNNIDLKEYVPYIAFERSDGQLSPQIPMSYTGNNVMYNFSDGWITAKNGVLKCSIILKKNNINSITANINLNVLASTSGTQHHYIDDVVYNELILALNNNQKELNELTNKVKNFIDLGVLNEAPENEENTILNTINNAGLYTFNYNNNQYLMLVHKLNETSFKQFIFYEGLTNNINYIFRYPYYETIVIGKYETANKEYVDEYITNLTTTKADKSYVDEFKDYVESTINYFNETIDGILKYYADKEFVENKLADLVGSAPETLDTIGEIATALKNNKNIVDVLNKSITDKADKSQVNSLERKINYLEQQTPKTYMTMANDTLIVSGAVFEDDVMIVDGIKVENDILLI